MLSSVNPYQQFSSLLCLSKTSYCPLLWKCIDATDSKLYFFCTFSRFQHVLLSVMGLCWDGNVHNHLSCTLQLTYYDYFLNYLNVTWCWSFSISAACCLKSISMQPMGDWVIPPACRHLSSSVPIKLHFISILLFSSSGPRHPVLPWFQLKQELIRGCQASICFHIMSITIIKYTLPLHRLLNVVFIHVHIWHAQLVIQHLISIFFNPF